MVSTKPVLSFELFVLKNKPNAVPEIEQRGGRFLYFYAIFHLHRYGVAIVKAL
jgi:hypothetical protein